MSGFGQILINIIFTGGGYALLSIGFNLFYKTRKFIDVSYGSLIAVGGYSMFMFSSILAFGFATSLLLSVLITVAVALILDTVIYERFTKNKVNSLIPLLASLGAYTVITAILAMLFTSQYQTLNTGAHKIFGILGGQISIVNVVLVLLGIVGSVGILYTLGYTKYGRGVRAVDDDKEVAEISGIPARNIVLKTVALGAVFASIVGIVVVYDIGILPIVGMHYLLRTFVICVMGGLGSIEGGLWSALIIATTENLTAYFLSSSWLDPVLFFVFLLILLLRPNGIFPRPQKE